ncbi:MAG: hypothetical protein EHM49_08870 [Deltaproteobacteria bacterium]|nr:MAG: hypothetical protein EHM49_08870 [Deltaproteobacteria bacterium]
MKVNLIILFSLFCLISSPAQARINCLDCHPDIKKQLTAGNIHNPLQTKDCTVCHNIHASDKPHLLIETTKDLCLTCHKTVFSAEYAHFPVTQGECDKCHDPHASPYKALLKDAEDKICFSCHEKKEIIIGNRLHPPLKKGCLSCHKAHGGEYPRLLSNPPEKLCLGCHQKTQISKSHNVQDIKGSTCLSCHNAHSSQKSSLLREFTHNPYAKNQCGQCHAMEGKRIEGIKTETRSLCLNCHPMEKADASVYSHTQASPDTNVCLDCHSPHLSDKKPVLKASALLFCFNCHQDTKMRVLSDSPDYKHKHPEVKKGACLECHSGHASNDLYFLKDDVAIVCTGCHKRHVKFTHPLGEKAIDPRCKKEMDCVSCHNPMGARGGYNTIFDYKKELCIQCHKIET